MSTKEDKQPDTYYEDKVKEIMSAYLAQEMGNKVTQFSVEGLTLMLLGILKEK